MSTLRRFGWLDLVLLLIVLAAAGGVRTAYLTLAADSGHSPGPFRVQDGRPTLKGYVVPDLVPDGKEPTELEILIHNVATQQGWFATVTPLSDGIEATAHVSPGYPGAVGLLGNVVALDQLPFAVRWIQVALGTLTCGLYFLFARRAFHSLTVATLAGLLTASYPFWVVSVAALEDGVLAAFLLSLALHSGARSGQEDGGAVSSLVFGLTLSCLALVRATTLPFCFVALVWLLLRCGSAKWLPALVAFFSFLAPLGFWTARNYQLYQEVVPVVDSASLHLWIGNNLNATGGPSLAEAKKSLPAEERAKLRAEKHQPARYAQLAPLAYEEIAADPGTALRRRVQAGLCFVFGERWLRDGTLAEETGVEGPEWLVNSAHAVFHIALLVLLLSLLGWRWSYAWRWESMPAALAVIWLPLPYLLGHAELLSGPRLPLDGLLLTLAAVALVGLLPGVGDGLRQGLGAKKEEEPAAA